MNLLRPGPVFLAAIILCAPTLAPAALAPRTDINPALLYWQGFNAMPSLSADESRQILDDPPTFPLKDGIRICAKFDGAFQSFRRAARMKVSCDWGADLSDGPAALLPNLVKTRQVVNAGMVRAYYALRAGRVDEAATDVLAVLALGRNTGADGTLVSVMVGVSVDNRVLGFIAGHFGSFSGNALERLARGLDEAPPRATVKQAIAVEETGFVDWALARIEVARAAHSGDEAQALKAAQAEFSRTLGGASDESGSAGGMIRAAGGTIDGLSDYVKQLRPVYAEMAQLAEAPPEELASGITRWERTVQRHTNLLVRLVIPAVGRARAKEIETTARLAMVRAAIERKLRGEEGFKSVLDPFGSGPFEFRRFQQGEDARGFELESQIHSHDLPGTMKFRESVDRAADPEPADP